MNSNESTPDVPCVKTENVRGAPINGIRQVLEIGEVKTFFDEENLALQAFLIGKNVDVRLICHEVPGEVLVINVRIPVRAPETIRHAIGEFLHRLNYESTRKLWEMDYDDGEIRLIDIIELCGRRLDLDYLRSVVAYILQTADISFPFLNAVMTRCMKPDFACDQALAALRHTGGREDSET